jgi:hypothetical protein
MANSFEQLLETLPDDVEFEFKGSVRKAVDELAKKAPKLKDSVLAQSEFSRKMDEVRDKVRRADEWDDWVSKNWVPVKDHPNGGMTKQELEYSERVQSLNTELEEARKAATGNGEEMTFEQLNQQLEKYTKDKGLVSKTDIDKLVGDKEKDFQQFVRNNSGAMMTAAMVAGELNVRHFKEFGEPFDTEAFVKSAVEKNRLDLKDYYEKDYVLDRRQKLLEEKHKGELEKIENEKKEAQKALDDMKEKLKTQAMGPSGQLSDNSGPDMGPLQRRMLGDQPAEGEKDKIPDVPLGMGGIAAAAARRDERLAMERRTA